MASIDPFANESDNLQIDDLTIEYRTDRVSIYGSIDITKDKKGLESAKMLSDLLSSIVQKLLKENLPDAITTGENIDTVKNPFE